MRTIVFAVFTFITAAACGQSPILHHHDAPETPSPVERVGSGTESTCPIAIGQDICATANWIIGPVLKTENRFRLSFTERLSREPIEVTSPIEVELWMPSMGHGSAPTRVTPVPDLPNTVDIENVHFIMPGDWEIRIRAFGQSGSVRLNL